MSNRNSYLQRLILAALASAVGWNAAPLYAQSTDISQVPLSSAANLSVLPNLLFTLDDSGSMAQDYITDNVGINQFGNADSSFMCKTDANTNNACMRMDPPFSAPQVNGLGYNPMTTYRPAFYYDGTSYGNQTSTSAKCDPFNNQSCQTMANAVMSTVYSTTNNPVGNWYGTAATVNLQTAFPEVMYCRTAGGVLSDLTQCRSNGLDNSTEPRNTGKTFRYTNARWGSAGPGGGYPEMEPVREFWRKSGTTTITVTTAYPLGISSGTLRIIPRTGTGTGTSGVDLIAAGTCNSNWCTATVTSSNTFTYGNSKNGQQLAYSGYDLVADMSKSGTTVTVTNAYNHGLITGDYITVTSIPTNSGLNATNVSVTKIDANSFKYTAPTSSTTTGTGYFAHVNLFNVPKLKFGGPISYWVDPIDYCTDVALTTCQTGTGTGFTYPAPVRYCIDQFDASRWDTPTGNDRTGTQPRCQKKFDDGRGYIYPRYGQFTRTDILSSSSFSGRTTRIDCTSGTCTQAQELTNFANWFSYYRTRMLMMKTSSGIAFQPIKDSYRVGFVTINPGSPVNSQQYLAIDTFDITQKKNWFKKFYDQEPGGGTPLREALSRAGRHFAGRSDGLNKGMPEDPVQYSCQQNFLLLTTDGYWNGNAGQTINSGSIGNVDNNASVNTVNNKLGLPIWDGGTPFNPDTSDSGYSSSDALSDVALYYYQTDLRPAGSIGALGADVSQDNVPTSDKDGANWQHMVTFGLGLADGLLEWRSDYESATAGDFYNIKKGSGTCTWDKNQCAWPMPHPDLPNAIDDLWHAAVNGRGTYFNARDPLSLQDGLNTALTNINLRNASAAAAATSTPNVTATDRTIFLSTYTTVQWNGQITAEYIDPNTGNIIPTPLWTAKELLQAQVSTSSDTRKIVTFDNTQPNNLKDFTWANMTTTTEQNWFQNKCTPLSNMSQCPLLVTADLAAANSGLNMVNFLRGQTGLEATVYRDRQFSLGDTVNAVPLYVGKPRLAFGDAVTPDYQTWATGLKTRTPVLYVGANDGMLHAFNGATGVEMWAYVPRMVEQNMWRLAEDNYATKHFYYVDGSPVSSDVYDKAAGTWKTILVGGLNSGGRGFYALDITDPNNPKALWEFCNDSTLCSRSDPDMGLSFGNPVITKRASDGKWVVLVTSGYNNTPQPNSLTATGKGFLYVLDAMTGAFSPSDKISTGVGGNCVTAPCPVGTDPSGLAKISAWADNYFIDNTTKWVYGGDLVGNVWKFDLTTTTPTVKSLGQAKDGSGKPQPITTKPALGLVSDVYKVIFVGTGRYLGNADLTDPATQIPAGTSAWQQSIYGFKDTDTNLGNLRASGLVQQTLTEIGSGTQRIVSSNTVNWTTANGWFIDLNPGNKSPGERVNIDPQLILGTLVVPTNVPGAGACSLGGDSWFYAVDYASGSYLINEPGGVVADKMTGRMMAGATTFQLGNGTVVVQRIMVGGAPIGGNPPTSPGGASSRRSSWREITQ